MELKRRIRKLNHQTALDLSAALDAKVSDMIKEAAGRARANGRKQVRGHDL